MNIVDTVQKKLIAIFEKRGGLTRCAKDCGVSLGYLTLLRTGKRTPALPVAQKILDYEM